MIRKLIFVVSVAFTATALPQTSTFQVRFEDERQCDSIISARSDLKFERIIPFAQNEEIESLHRESGLHLWYIVYSNEKTVAQDIEVLSRQKGVRIAMPVTYIRMPERHNPSNYETSESKNRQVQTKSADKGLVNDPLYSKQWHYSHPEYVNIDLERAWAIEKGKRNVVVAVMDGTIDHRHPDLSPNMWVNEAELNGQPGVDDDGNGYIDDIYGPQLYPDTGFSDHATHIAGTIAAVNNNGIGVCGIAGGNGMDSGVRLMSVGIANDSGKDFIPDWLLFRGFVYAADNGAVIASNSWADVNLPNPIKTEALNYFIRNAGKYEGSPMKGGLVIFAAANDNVTEPPSPINSNDVDRTALIVVGATSCNGVKASYSNYGTWVDIAAPGGDLDGNGIYSCFTNNRYGFMNGTSMACPHVSGVAALVVSKFGNGNITPNDVKRILVESSSPIDPYQAGYGYQGRLGKGIVNAYNALQSDPGIIPELPYDIEMKYIERIPKNFILATWRIPSDGNGNAPAYIALYEEKSDTPIIKIKTSGYKVGSVFSMELPETLIPMYDKFRLKSIDFWGNESEFSENVNVSKIISEANIWNTYSTDNFVLYKPTTASFSWPLNRIGMQFPFQSPSGYVVKVEDSNNVITNLNNFGSYINFDFRVSEETPLGTFPFSLILENSNDPADKAELKLSYTVRDCLKRINGPEPIDNEKMHFYVSDLKGNIKLNVRDYIFEPHGLDFIIPDEKGDNADYISFDKLEYVCENEILTVDYELSEDNIDWFDAPGVLTLHPYNSYFVTNNIEFYLHYDPEASVSDVNAEANASPQGIYTMTGIKLSITKENLPSGLYIIDGKKTLIK